MPSGNLGKQGKKIALNLATFAQMNTILHKILHSKTILNVSTRKGVNSKKWNGFLVILTRTITYHVSE